MKTMAWQVRLLAAGFGIFLLGACDVDQTEEGRMPDIEVEGGELPEYDVDAPEVEVGTKKDTVVVETPTVDVNLPEDGDGQ
ncbi:MAG: hypothetical protein ACR2GQ_08050 [Gemmatimonadota bacterium]